MGRETERAREREIMKRRYRKTDIIYAQANTNRGNVFVYLETLSYIKLCCCEEKTKEIGRGTQ